MRTCVQYYANVTGPILVVTRPQRGAGALWTPKLSHGTVRFVGAKGAGDFVLGIQPREFFWLDPMCLYSKYSEFRGAFKNLEKHKKGYVATLPTSGPLVILPPLCSLAHHRLRLNSAAIPTVMYPSTNLPVRCKLQGA